MGFDRLCLCTFHTGQGNVSQKTPQTVWSGLSGAGCLGGLSGRAVLIRGMQELLGSPKNLGDGGVRRVNVVSGETLDVVEV